MKKPKAISIAFFIIIVGFLSSFIFIHTNPIRVAKRYNFYHGYFKYHLKEAPQLEYTSDDKRNVRVHLLYNDNSASGMGVYKTKLGLWIIIPNSVYDF